MESRYREIQSILESPHVENAVPILNDYLAMCPYSREAHIQLLYCYYVKNDVVMLKRLLQKLMRGLDATVSSRAWRGEA